MQITFDGIAKGYAVDRVAELLEMRGYHNYLVNFSGNMRWRGQSIDKKPWNIAVWDPAQKKITPIPSREQGAIATSGNEHQSGHLIDPRTTKPITSGPQSVSAIGPSAAICDVLSTTFFIQTESERQAVIKALVGQYQAIVTP
jgi:thiamine biosynthesis lipoprotein